MVLVLARALLYPFEASQPRPPSVGPASPRQRQRQRRHGALDHDAGQIESGKTMSWFFSSTPLPSSSNDAKNHTEEALAPVSPASAAAAAFEAVKSDEQVRGAVVSFASDPEVQRAAYAFASNDRVQAAALDAAGVGGQQNIANAHKSDSVNQPSAKASSVTAGHDKRTATLKNETEKPDRLHKSLERSSSRLTSEETVKLMSGLQNSKNGNNDAPSFVSEMRMKIPGVPDDSVFLQQLRLYALAGNLERQRMQPEGCWSQSECHGNSVMNPEDACLVDLFEELLMSSMREAKDTSAAPMVHNDAEMNETQRAEQGKLADLMLQRLTLAIEEESGK